uniref:Uncharacterized protein n=1 Tax=Panagrolaimus sp. PS1159 TaxID=55785 RepID=A0AC35FGE4_9BILA
MAKYAYYIYQSPDSTCILTIKFDDLFQGDYDTKNPIKIQSQEINLIASKVKDFYYPFFTIDTILGTAVFLTFKDDKLSAVHYKIDENDLTTFKKSDGAESILWYFENPNNYKNSNPTFTSFGKSTVLFFAIEEYSNVIGIWSPKHAYTTLLDIDDNHRRLYFLDSDYIDYFTMDYFEEDTEHEIFLNLRSNSSSTSFIHLNKAYFQKNQELEKVSDFHLFVMAFIRLCIIGFLIALITILSFCILATSLTSLVVVLDNVDYQLGLIRNADIFNPLPSTNQPIEAVSSDPKLAPQPSPLMEEGSLTTTSSSVIWCNNLFINDEMDTNHEMEEMESDETQSLTSYTSFDRNYSNA